MKKLLLLGALLVGATVGLQNSSDAHGGTYRGPGDTVPPGGGGGGGGGGPGTPGPGAPSTPGPAGPSAPSPGTPGAPAGSPRAAPSAPITGLAGGGAELTLWQFWWGFNKEPYLNLKSRIHSGGITTGSDDFFLSDGEQNAKDRLRPSQQKIRESVVPALLKALETERQNDIMTGCLIALAKIGDTVDEGGESQFEQIIKSFLNNPTQEIAETAALALGILGNETAIDTLVALMMDEKSPDGSIDPHALVGATEVPVRTRAFAAYGLGLIGYRSDKNEVRQRIAEYLMDMLDAPELSSRDVKVGAMISLGITRLDIAAPDAKGPEKPDSKNQANAFSRQTQIEYLLDYYDESEMRSHEKTRHFFTIAHAPTAMARLLQDGTGHVEEAFDTGESGLKDKIARELLDGIDEHSDREIEIQQSCVLALGQIGDCDNGANKADEIDKAIRKELFRQIKDGKDEQCKRYALISLSQIGGRLGRGEDKLGGSKEITLTLLDQMEKGQSKMRPWAALSLGVMGYALLEARETPDVAVDKALAAACEKQKSPEDVGAYCLALGLRRYKESMQILIDHMQKNFSDLDARGEAAVALGLMEERSAIDEIQAVIEESKYKPELLKQAAIALGLLGDKKIVGKLVEMLSTANGLATQSAISSALGMIGDVSSIDPLITLLQNKEITESARGFAAVALGIVCDKEDLPWNTKISVNTNYRANTSTLTDQGQGILDIL